MTTLQATPEREWWTRPSVVLPVVGVIALLVALVTPQTASGRMGDARLSSHLYGSLGARLFFETASRFGWHTIQRDSEPAPGAWEAELAGLASCLYGGKQVGLCTNCVGVNRS